MTLTNNDLSLIEQMIRAGRMSAIYDLLPKYHEIKTKEMIEKMGEKYVLHPSNQVKKLDVPLDTLQRFTSKVLRAK